MLNFKKLIFGTNTKKKIKKYKNLLQETNQLSKIYENKDQSFCLLQIEECRKKLASGAEINSILPDVFSLVRLAAMNTIGQRHFDVQILGGIALHDGQIAEMKTGEGKTLTSTLPVVLNALYGKGVHIVTVNDYLAKRDSQWMEPVFQYLGLTVGIIQHGMTDLERREQYGKDITYGTNNEFGFDYLRDNMKYSKENIVQRGHFFTIIDEVDSILIDEARTPLIISGPSDESTDKYQKVDDSVFSLKRAFRLSDNPKKELIAKSCGVPIEKVDDVLAEKKDSDVLIIGDYVLDEKSKNIQLTEEGAKKIEQRLSDELSTDNLYDSENINLLHHINLALKARYIFKKDIDYVVKDKKVIIVDEFTGRLMEGRRFSDGLHQALEAKEGLSVEKENQTLATITYQNYFRKYEKLAGMTGTAETEEDEFYKIYGLGVVVIPTNKQIIRIDNDDAIYKTSTAKNTAIVSKVVALYKKGQPVLVGSDSIEYSEELSMLLKKLQIPHNVLNAKHYEREAEIIAEAGREGAVTIATNMAGRGTDIKIDEVSKKKGGLFILGAIRHESRRIDNQLRGRAGRQGDPGESKFFISLEDNLLRVFGGERIGNLMTTLKYDENEAIEHALISRAIENAQKNVESRNFSIRKHLLEYDDVMSKQREIVYSKRKDILLSEKYQGILNMSKEYLFRTVDLYCSKNKENWDTESLKKVIHEQFNLYDFVIDEENNAQDLYESLCVALEKAYNNRRNELGEVSNVIEKHISLDVLDSTWKEHLLNLDFLKESVSLSGYAQKNPLDEYKKGAFNMFTSLIDEIEEKSTFYYFRVRRSEKSVAANEKKLDESKMIYNSSNQLVQKHNLSSQGVKKAPIRKKKILARNDKCFCGSGKKHKNCCMQNKIIS